MSVSRLKDISSFIVMDVLEKAHELERQGISVIHLEVGEPDFDTPACIKNAICKAMDDGQTHYTHSLGTIELREAICENYHKQYGVTVFPDQILVCSGTSPAMFIMFAALLEKGDQVIISDPHYACYPNFIKFLDAEPVTVKVFEEDGFQYRPEVIKKKISHKTKAIFINSPSNPTGNLLSPDRMAEIAEFSPYILSDEIYHGLVYEGK
jgi:aspartate/methionine/tyrosine aminotransferase